MGNDLFYLDEHGQKQDSALWEELLGEKFAEPRTAIAVRRKHPETLVHQAADKHYDELYTIVRQALDAGQAAIDKPLLQHAIKVGDRHQAEIAMSAAPDVVRKTLLKSFPAIFHKILIAGGQAGTAILNKQLRVAGGPGSGPQKEDDQRTKSLKKYGDIGPYKVQPVIGDDPKPTTVVESLKREANVLHWDLQIMHKDFPGRASTISMQKRFDGLAEQIAKLEPRVLATGDDEEPTNDELDAIEQEIEDPDLAVGFSFDDSSTAAQDWAEEHAAELSADIADSTRQDIADALVASFDKGDMSTAEEDIIAAVGDDARGELIANTETMVAANEGQRESWLQAIEDGYLSGAEKRVWIAIGDPSTCDDCDELDGEETDIDGQYPDPGEEGPPLHPNCRCTEGIVGTESGEE